VCLAAWIGWVTAGNFVRNISVYSRVLICAVPAVAAAAALSARLIGVVAPLLAMVAVFQPCRSSAVTGNALIVLRWPRGDSNSHTPADSRL
jgi:hypothetical protein